KNAKYISEGNAADSKLFAVEDEVSMLEKRIVDLEQNKNSDFNMMLRVMQSSREETDKFTLADLKKADMMIYAITAATQQRMAKDDQLILWNVKEVEETEAKVVETIEKIAKNPVQRFWRIGKDANPCLE
ncbi:hypothetical protein Ciccas_012199, partial [Cichlidogyrus casuarinus]